jgi:hypothetical protein
MGVKLTFRDHGYNALQARAKKMARVVTLTVGIHEAEGQRTKIVPAQGLLAGIGKNAPNGVTVIDVANWMEFGTSKIPARSFIRAWADETQREDRKQIKSVMTAALAGGITEDQGLEILGLRFVGSIQERISKGIPPKLAQSTIDRKDSSVPLINTGQLRASVTFHVEK